MTVCAVSEREVDIVDGNHAVGVPDPASGQQIAACWAEAEPRMEQVNSRIAGRGKTFPGGEHLDGDPVVPSGQ